MEDQSNPPLDKSNQVYDQATNFGFRLSVNTRRATGSIRRARGGLTQQKDETLRNAVAAYKGLSWKKIAKFFPDRSEVQCLHRWQKVLKPELIKGLWTQEVRK